MRLMKKALPLVCTLLLLALGFSMPRLAALLMDQQLEADKTQLKQSNISFTLAQEADIFQTLTRFTEGHVQVILSEGYRMTAKEVTDAAIRARAATLNTTGYVEAPRVTPILLSSRYDPSTSAVFWKCVWWDTSSQQVILWLDDQSGQMVSLTGRAPPNTLSTANTKFPPVVTNLAEYCRLNYPVDSVKLSIDGATVKEARYTILMTKTKNGQEETHAVSILLANNMLYFNN